MMDEVTCDIGVGLLRTTEFRE